MDHREDFFEWWRLPTGYLNSYSEYMLMYLSWARGDPCGVEKHVLKISDDTDKISQMSMPHSMTLSHKFLDIITSNISLQLIWQGVQDGNIRSYRDASMKAAAIACQEPGYLSAI